MSLVFAAFVPHPPVIIPSIGKDGRDKIAATEKAFSALEQELYASKPDVIIAISPHGDIHPDSFTFNLSEKYQAGFEAFGDFSTKIEFRGETIMIAAAKEKINDKFPVSIVSEEKIDHGLGVPLYCLARHLENVRLIPLYFSLLDNQTHFEFGKVLKDLIFSTEKRVAVIASGDLSHCLTEDAPMPFNPDGKTFDNTIIDSLKAKEPNKILNLDQKIIDNAGECGLRSLLILLGALHNVNYRTDILSYEAPFGVGYLIANFKLD